MNKLYGRLAVINMKNSRQFYVPYLLTGIVSVAMYYLVLAMQDNPGLDSLGGGAQTIRMILGFGVAVVGVFVSIFLFYTNSFIMKRRKKELGVYNILGMEKKHIARMLFLETFFLALTAILGGLLSGIVFNKLMTMILYRLTDIAANIPFFISWPGCRNTVILFGFIYGATLLYNLMQIKLANPIELLHSTSVGEREPKTKLLMALIGVGALGAGYFIALTTCDAVSAVTYFFVAVLLVILGTYCLFTSGSIAFLKMLRKNKNYYYRAKHFTTVSGMIYRMKQNAVGLANICILSTMVLVTVSTTVSMYLGTEDVMKSRFPSEISVTAYYSQMPEDIRALRPVTEQALKASGRVVSSENAYFNVTQMGIRDGNKLSITDAGVGYNIGNMATITILTRADYEAYSGEAVSPLAQGEVALSAIPAFEGDTLVFEGTEYLVRQICRFPEEKNADYLASMGGGKIYLVVPDEGTVLQIYDNLVKGWGEQRVEPSLRFDVECGIDGTAQEKLDAESALHQALAEWETAAGSQTAGYKSVYMEAREESRNDFYRLYGGLFFLGMFLGSLFLMVTVLIIFYKQISEGYEDKERYAIMQKVGMSSVEVKRAIRSQVLTVFFLPIAAAIVHVIMAFPMITMLLQCLNLMNRQLFAWCMAGTALVFGLIYLLVYLLTSRSYYRIVGS